MLFMGIFIQFISSMLHKLNDKVNHYLGLFGGIFHTTSIQLQIDLYQNNVNVIRYSIVATIIRMPFFGHLIV